MLAILLQLRSMRHASLSALETCEAKRGFRSRSRGVAVGGFCEAHTCSESEEAWRRSCSGSPAPFRMAATGGKKQNAYVAAKLESGVGQH